MRADFSGFFPFLAVLCLLLAASPATAERIEIDYPGLSPAMRQCLDEKLAPETLDKLRSGAKIRDRSESKRIKKAFQGCQASTGLTLPGEAALYDGPLFDAMSQIDESVDMDMAMSRARKAGVGKIALFARSLRVLGQNEQALIDLARRNPDLIVLGAPKYFQHDRDIGRDFVRSTLNGIREHGYRFVGEILYTHADKSSGKQHDSGERYTNPLLPGTEALLKGLASLGVPLMTHFEPYAPERDFPRFHQLYESWPDQIFVVPHMGFCSPAQVEEFMSRHPNVWMTISKKPKPMSDFSSGDKLSAAGSPLLESMALRPEWRELLIRYQDRLLMATDAHMRLLWESYQDEMLMQRVVLGQLPRAVAEKIAYLNAERLYGVLAH